MCEKMASNAAADRQKTKKNARGLKSSRAKIDSGGSDSALFLRDERHDALHGLGGGGLAERPTIIRPYPSAWKGTTSRTASAKEISWSPWSMSIRW